MIRLLLAVASVACLAGCNTQVPPSVSFGGPPLISGQSPPAPLARRSEPQDPNSLPPGAAGVGASGPLGTAPDSASVTVKLP